MENAVEIQRLEQQIESLKLLKNKFYDYLDLLDDFKFQKMKYMRAVDKFEEAMQHYENLDENTSEEETHEAWQCYEKWKGMVAKNHQMAIDAKATGEKVLADVERLRRELGVVVSAERTIETIDEKIEEYSKKIEELKCVK